MMDCNRFELLETIVRIANTKYKTSGVTKTTYEAVEMMIEQMKTNPSIGISSHSFRTEVLWTRDCNLTLDANLKEIKKLYDYLNRTKVKKVN
jgi:hypothetical protein